MGFAPLTPEAITEIKTLRGEALDSKVNALSEEDKLELIKKMLRFKDSPLNGKLDFDFGTGNIPNIADMLLSSKALFSSLVSFLGKTVSYYSVIPLAIALNPKENRHKVSEILDSNENGETLAAATPETRKIATIKYLKEALQQGAILELEKQSMDLAEQYYQLLPLNDIEREKKLQAFEKRISTIKSDTNLDNVRKNLNLLRESVKQELTKAQEKIIQQTNFELAKQQLEAEEAGARAFIENEESMNKATIQIQEAAIRPLM